MVNNGQQVEVGVFVLWEVYTMCRFVEDMLQVHSSVPLTVPTVLTLCAFLIFGHQGQLIGMYVQSYVASVSTGTWFSIL